MEAWTRVVRVVAAGVERREGSLDIIWLSLAGFTERLDMVYDDFYI